MEIAPERTQNMNAPLNSVNMTYRTQVGGFGTPGRWYESKVKGVSMAVGLPPRGGFLGSWCYRWGVVDIEAWGARRGVAGDGAKPFNWWQEALHGMQEREGQVPRGKKGMRRLCIAWVRSRHSRATWTDVRMPELGEFLGITVSPFKSTDFLSR